MSVYTKKGDSGYTDLYGKGRVHKSDEFIDALGHIDELTSQIGIVRATLEDEEIKTELLHIQDKLIKLMAEISSKFENKIDLTDEIKFLESRIDTYTKLYPKIDYFIKPGDEKKAAPIDVARVVARRAERALSKIIQNQDTTSGAYINRLSDYLYTLARKTEFNEKIRKLVELEAGSQLLNMSQQLQSLNLKIAKWIAEEVEKEAKKLGVTVVIALVNKEGNPILIHRMDEAFSISFSLARKKAFTASALKMPTHELAELTKEGAPFYNLEKMLDEEIVTLGGGFPILMQGSIIGAIGVSGDTVENDQYLAQYGTKIIERMKQ